jgi:hypothetical protein
MIEQNKGNSCGKNCSSLEPCILWWIKFKLVGFKVVLTVFCTYI